MQREKKDTYSKKKILVKLEKVKLSVLFKATDSRVYYLVNKKKMTDYHYFVACFFA